MVHDINVLNEEMDAAGTRFFASVLKPAGKAKSLRKQPGGEVVITDGPYLETKEHMGLWIIEAADMGEALEWGRKAVVACRVLSRSERSSKSGRIENHSTTETRNEKAQNFWTHLAGRCDPALRR